MWVGGVAKAGVVVEMSRPGRNSTWRNSKVGCERKRGWTGKQGGWGVLIDDRVSQQKGWTWTD